MPPADYKPGQTRAPLVWKISIPVCIIGVTLASLRFYVRAILVKEFGKDDWLLLTAVLSLCVLLGGEVWGTFLGIGKHQYDLRFEEFFSSPSKVVCYSISHISHAWSLLHTYV